MMPCSVKQRCPGEYEERKILHALRHQNQIVVVDHVPVKVCSVCGDVLIKAETVRRIEKLLETGVSPAGTVPLYEFT